MGQTRVAVDIGTQFVKIITVTGPGDAGRVRIRPVGPSGSRAVLTELAATGAEVCLAVPDAWLNGSEAGAREQEALRQVAEDELGLTGVRWAGQLAAVAALAASRGTLTDERAAGGDQAGRPAAGRYLIADVGAAGVRVALCQVSVTPGPGYSVRQLAVHVAEGGGWRDWDAAVLATLGADSDPALGTWYEQAIAQGKRARLVFDRAKAAPDFRSARVYALAGGGNSYELTAGQAAECFASTADRLNAGVTEVLTSADPGLTAVLNGGLAWFPLAAATLADLTGSAPLILRPEAAARGALLLADDQAALGGCGLPAVSVPMHEVKDGLLGEVRVPLPWTASFAAAGETSEPLYIDDAKLTLDIGASRVTVPLPAVADGPYRAAARPSWAGGGVLVLRADQPQETVPWASAAPDPGVHVVPLGPYAQR